MTSSAIKIKASDPKITELKTWQISDSAGNSATILNLGARLINWQTVASKGNNIIVGYEDIADYINDGIYTGAIAGPFANRIAGASFEANGKKFNLGSNEGDNHLHGGEDGLEKVLWQPLSLQNDCVVLIHQHRPDAEHVDSLENVASPENIGYPGNIDFKVTYKIEPKHGLSIHIEATSSQIVPIGPTGHAYFNLGDHSDNINKHKLQIAASSFTPVDEHNIPTGEIKKVATQFDYLKAKSVVASLDNNFVLDENNIEQPAAVLSLDKTALSLEVFTDYPGVQVYTGDHMSSPFVVRNAICIEPQFFPDSPNKAHFPFEYTSPDKPFSKNITYKMVCLQNETPLD